MPKESHRFLRVAYQKSCIAASSEPAEAGGGSRHDRYKLVQNGYISLEVAEAGKQAAASTTMNKRRIKRTKIVPKTWHFRHFGGFLSI
jgi:hypothetical protein